MKGKEKVEIRLDSVMPGLKCHFPKDAWEETVAYGQLMLRAHAEGKLDELEIPSTDSEGQLYYDGSGETWGDYSWCEVADFCPQWKGERGNAR